MSYNAPEPGNSHTVYTSPAMDAALMSANQPLSYMPLANSMDIIPQNVMFQASLTTSYPQASPSMNTSNVANANMMSIADRPKPPIMILERYKQLRDEGRYCDLFIDVKGMRFLAHKSLVAAWSPYFDEALTCTNYVEKDLLIIHYDSYEVFSDLLEFLYTGSIAPRETNFLQLLHLAVSFKIDLLKSYCEEFLRCNLHLGNFISTYFLSRKYSLDELEESLVGFLGSNLSDAVKQSEFLQMKAEKLHSLLSKGKMIKLKPEMKLFLVISWVGFDVQPREKFLVLLLKHIDWSAVASDFLLEISRTDNFFTTHESSLYLLLQTLHSSNISLGPFSETFTSLRRTYSHLLTEVVQHGVIIPEPDDFVPVIAVGATTRHIKLDSSTNTDIRIPVKEVTQSVFPDTIQNKTALDNFVDQILPTATNQQSSDHAIDDVANDNISLNQSAKQKDSENALSTAENEATFDKSPKLRKLPGRNRRVQRKETIWINPLDEPSAKHQKDGYVSHQNEENNSDNSTIHEVNQGHSTENKKTDEFLEDDTEKSEGKENFEEEDESSMFLEEEEDEDEEEEEASPAKAKIKPKKKTVTEVHSKVRLVCQYCDYYTYIKRRLDKHIKWNHENDTELKCTVCNAFVSKSNRKYLSHMRTHFDGPPFSCEIMDCDYVSDKFTMLLSHRMKHFEDRPFSCDICGAKFRTRNNVYAHKKVHEGKKPFKCPCCEKCFTLKNTLDQHLVTHDDFRPYLCDLCGFSTKFQSHLTAHKRTHTGDMFKCDHPKCDYQSPKRSQLKAHMKIHLGIRSFTCVECGKSFIEKSHLKRHMLIHLPDKPYKCVFCDYGANRKDKLKYHMEHTHNGNADKKQKGRKKKPKASPLPDAIYVHRLKNTDHTGYTIQAVPMEPNTVGIDELRRASFAGPNLDGITIQVPISMEHLINIDEAKSSRPLPATSPVTPVTLIPEDHQMYIQNVMTQVPVTSQQQEQTTHGPDYASVNAFMSLFGSAN